MAKLKVDEIEATSTNTNVKISPKGTGILEAKGALNDATLQLNCAANSHGVKIKAPPDSSGQNYTLVLPDNQIAQDKLLKVKSITGSGTTAVGQLEYADNPIPSNPVFSATNLTSGTVPNARLASFPATAGAGFKLISRFHPPFNQAFSSVEFSVDNNAVYRIVIKACEVNSSLRCQFGSSTSNYYTDQYRFHKWFGYRNYATYNSSGSDSFIDLEPDEGNQTSTTWYYATADFITTTGNPTLFLRGFNPKNHSTQIKIMASFYKDSNETNAAATRTVGAIKFYPSGFSGMGYNDWAIYKYVES